MGTFSYFPHTEDDIRQMLDRIGVQSLDDLYSDVPAGFIYKREYDLPDALSEQEVRDFFEALASRNAKLKVFAGAGAYDHYTPSVIPYIISRSEFLTAYTPYQCEISQGTLRYIFEYQSMICALTGMDVSNASMYDGPTAAAEAMRMAVASARKKNTVLLSRTLLPNVVKTVETYAKYYGTNIAFIEAEDGRTSLESLRKAMECGDVAGAIVPGINRFGIVEDLTGFAEVLHAGKALLVEYCDPSALAVLRTPAEWGADVAVGDGQLRRPLRGFHGLHQGPHAQAPRPHRRRDRGRAGKARVRAHPPGPRAAYPPREGHFQHLLQRVPDGPFRDGLSVTYGS